MSTGEKGVITLEEVPRLCDEHAIISFFSPFMNNDSRAILSETLRQAPCVLVENVPIDVSETFVRKLTSLGAKVSFCTSLDDARGLLLDKRQGLGIDTDSGVQADIGNATLIRESETLKLKLQEARRTEACLVIVLGKPLGKRFVLNSKTMLIGRGSECGISILDSSLSRAHAEVLKKESGQYYVSDLSSTNGTYLNDHKLAPGNAVEVKDGDLLKMGNMILKFIGRGKIDNVFHKDILNLATRDNLTGTLNRQSLLSALEEGFQKATVNKRPLSAIVLDLDHFKSINDTYGHAGGDFVLKETVKVVQTVIRGDDFIGRFGGDEFMVVLWDSSLANACIVAERIRSKIKKHSFLYAGKRIPVTVSLGVSSLDDSVQSVGKLFERADGAQYNAKKNGGNQVSAL